MTIEKLMTKIVILPNGCWEWQACVDGGGYSMTAHEGKTRRAHIVSYLLTKGPIPEGLQLDHTCHRPPICMGGKTCRHRRCINPDHLEAVTKDENGRRGNHNIAKFFACGHAFQRAKTHCPKGHEYSSENTARRCGDQSRRCKQCDRDYANARNRRLRLARVSN